MWAFELTLYILYNDRKYEFEFLRQSWHLDRCGKHLKHLGTAEEVALILTSPCVPAPFPHKNELHITRNSSV